MNSHTDIKTAVAAPILVKADPTLPALIVTGLGSIAIRAGTTFAGITFAEQTDVAPPADGYRVGGDYVVNVPSGDAPSAVAFGEPLIGDHGYIGGFHFAPGGNAVVGRFGGDLVPAINPFSLWDVNFRPSCPDPRGMTLVTTPAGRFWCDVYLTGVNHHADGTSRFGVAVCDGNDLPLIKGERARKFDYATAVALMAEHAKRLLSLEEFFAAAFGVTEKSSHDGDPETTGLDAQRTSKWGVMQATGNMWVWGHDGDPDMPRASFFGGSWWDGDLAGSRCANVDSWPGNSYGHVGARGRSDHLQLG